MPGSSSYAEVALFSRHCHSSGDLLHRGLLHVCMSVSTCSACVEHYTSTYLSVCYLGKCWKYGPTIYSWVSEEEPETMDEVSSTRIAPMIYCMFGGDFGLGLVFTT